MSKQRDSKTGHYISEEEAQGKDPATWTKEKDRRRTDRSATFGADDRKHLLTNIYASLLNSAQEVENLEGADLTDVLITKRKLNEIFKAQGVEIE